MIIQSIGKTMTNPLQGRVDFKGGQQTKDLLASRV